MSVLLDTNVVIAIFAEEVTVLNKLDLTPEVYLPAPVVGELCLGAFKSDRPDENLSRVDSFAGDCGTIDCDRTVGREYGAIKAALESQGRLIPENDLWIAACARVSGLPLITRDEHFERVEGIVIARW